jgi:hypothetical protein
MRSKSDDSMRKIRSIMARQRAIQRRLRGNPNERQARRTDRLTSPILLALLVVRASPSSAHARPRGAGDSEIWGKSDNPPHGSSRWEGFWNNDRMPSDQRFQRFHLFAGPGWDDRLIWHQEHGGNRVKIVVRHKISSTIRSQLAPLKLWRRQSTSGTIAQ